MERETRYWFPAKRYGWGWGFPTTWEGWVVFAVYLVLLCAPMPWLAVHPVALVLYTLVLTAGLIVVCLLKGEPPRWRWGK